MKRVILMAAVVLAAMAGKAMALTATSNLVVTATAISNCRVDSVTNVAFGNYDPTDPTANTAGSGNIISRCTKNTTYRVYITGTRTMAAGLNNLNFQLYTDVGRTVVFPATFLAASPSTSASNAPVTTNVYGAIPPQQDVPTGGYSATLIATVEY